MTPYTVAVFIHVVGVLGLFTAMGLEWVLVARLRRIATVEQARDWLSLLGVIRRLSPASLAAILVSGLYMMFSTWGGVAWIIVAFVAVLLLPPLGMIAGLRLPRVQRDLEGHSGPLPAELRQRLDQPLFLASIQIRTAIAVGIVFLMTNKPDALASAIAIAAAIVIGLGLSVPTLNRRRASQTPT